LRSRARWLPRSTIRPASSTTISVGITTVDRRCAMTMRRAPRGDAFSVVLDLGLGAAVERARRLVEDQDRRILEQGPRDRDALLLAARQLQSALADFGVVTVGQDR
jgi:hypothetical protein